MVVCDLEYVLPRVNNFKDCFRLTQQDADPRRIILVHNEFFNWEKGPVLEAYRAACDQHVMFALDPYVVSECPGVPRQRPAH